MSGAFRLLILFVLLFLLDVSLALSFEDMWQHFSKVKVFNKQIFSDMLECRPDPSIELSSSLPKAASSWHLLTEDDRYRLLSRLGLPFLIDMQDAWRISCLSDVLVLLREDIAMCCRYSPLSSQELFFLVHPEERWQWYGAERLEELHSYLDLPAAWNTIVDSKFKFNREIRNAEMEIAALHKNEARGPAVLLVMQFFTVLGHISLADITLDWGGKEKNMTAMDLRTRLRPDGMEFHMLRGWMRRGEQLRVQQKLRYQQGVDELNTIVENATKKFPSVISRAIESYERHVEKLEYNREMLRGFRETQEKIRSSEMEKVKRTQETIARVHMENRENEQRLQKKITCYHLYRVSRTLKASLRGVPSRVDEWEESEYRKTIENSQYSVYYHLLQKHECPDGLAFSEKDDKGEEQKEEKQWIEDSVKTSIFFDQFVQQRGEEKSEGMEGNMWDRGVEKMETRTSFGTTKKIPTHLIPAASLIWEHVRQFYVWRQKTGYTHTISQSFALFYALFVVHHPENVEYFALLESDRNLTISISALIQNVLPFQPHELVAFTANLLRQGSYLSQLQTYFPRAFPTSTRAELWYFLSTLELFYANNELNEDGGGINHGLGVLHLYQAVWYGSRHASSAMATMRELGIFIAQHDRVAGRLLYLLSLDSTNDILRQLLRRRIHHGGLVLDRAACPVHSALNSSIPQQKVIFYSSAGLHSASERRDQQMKSVHDQSSAHGDFDPPRRENNYPLPLSRLLRYSRILDGFTGAWYTVDHPYVTKQSLETFIFDSFQENDEYETEGDEDHYSKTEFLFLQAMIFLSGIHNISRNLNAAECLLLSILRTSGFYCDVSHSLYDVFLERDWNTVCKQHSNIFFLGDHSIPCGWKQLDTLPDSLHESTYDILEKSLVWLSFIYMIQEKPELSSFYAMLAVDLSHIVYSNALRVVEDRHLKRLNFTHSKNASLSSENLPWHALRVLNKMKIDDSSPSIGFSSSFSSRYPLLFMAMGQLMTLTEPKKACVVDSIVRETLISGFGIHFLKGEREESPELDETKAEEMPSKSLAQVFVLLLSAAGEKITEASRENAKKDELHPNSVEGTDPFYVLVWLIQQISFSVDYSHRFSPLTLLQLSRPYLSVLGSSAYALLPRPSEGWITFGCRLCDEASKINLHGVLSLAFQLHLDCRAGQFSPSMSSLGYALHKKSAKGVFLRLRREALYYMRAPRIQPSLIAYDAEMYLSGSGYLTLSKGWDTVVNKIFSFFTKTTTDRLLEKFEDSILPSYFPKGSKPPFLPSAVDFPFSTRDIFLSSFTSTKDVRSFSSGLFLFSSVLEAGSSQSFSLLFYAADEGKNKYLQPFATTLARDIWGRSTVVSMWREEHLQAQWQLERLRKNKKPHSYVFSLDYHTPFYYAFQESRQELMSRISLWNAKVMFTNLKKSLAEEHRVNVSALPPDNLLIDYRRKSGKQRKGEKSVLDGLTSESVLRTIKEELLLCTSYINYLDAIEKRPCSTCVQEGEGEEGKDSAEGYADHIKQSPYDGMILPAADMACVQELLMEKMVALTPTERDLYIAYLKDLVDRSSIYYRINETNENYVQEKKKLEGKFCDFRDVVEPSEYGELTVPYFLVEPWKRYDLKGWGRLKLGEGVFFNRRLHRLSGSTLGIYILHWRNKFCHLTGWC